MQQVLIAGSRDATPQMIDYARRAVRRAQIRGFGIIVGDNPKGVDMAVVNECNSLKIPVIVAGVSKSPRNGGCKHGTYVKVDVNINSKARERYMARDRWMVDQADIGLFVWNGDSPGTKTGYDYMIAQGKEAHLINYP